MKGKKFGSSLKIAFLVLQSGYFDFSPDQQFTIYLWVFSKYSLPKWGSSNGWIEVAKTGHIFQAKREKGNVPEKIKNPKVRKNHLYMYIDKPKKAFKLYNGK